MESNSPTVRLIDFGDIEGNDEPDDFFVDLETIDIDATEDDVNMTIDDDDDDDDNSKTSKEEKSTVDESRRKDEGERIYPITFCFYKPVDMISVEPSSTNTSRHNNSDIRKKKRPNLDGVVRRTHHSVFQIAAEAIRSTCLKHPNRGDVLEEREHVCFRISCFPFRVVLKSVAYLSLLVFWILHLVFTCPGRCMCPETQEDDDDARIFYVNREGTNDVVVNMVEDEEESDDDVRSDVTLNAKTPENMSRPKGYESSRAMREKFQRMERKKYNVARTKEGKEEESVSFLKSIMLMANKKTVDFSLRHTFVPEHVRRDDEILPEDASKKTRRAMANLGFSHVELSTNDATYFIRWGTTFTKIEKKTFSGSRYGNQGIMFSKRDYDTIVEECERAWKKRLQFDYVGNLANFVVPNDTKRSLCCLFVPSKRSETDYVYRTPFCVPSFFKSTDIESKDIHGEDDDDPMPNATFCSKFIAKTLSKTSAFSFILKDVDPALVTPIDLYYILKRYQESFPLLFFTDVCAMKRVSKPLKTPSFNKPITLIKSSRF